MEKYWITAGLDIKQLFMSDGSGLARRNKVTALFLNKLLTKAQENGLGSNIDFASLLPKMGKEGTVKILLEKTDHAGKYAMKSGSMGDVQCYSGYFPAENPKFTITILVNNFTNPRRALLRNIENLLLEFVPEFELIYPEILAEDADSIS